MVPLGLGNIAASKQINFQLEIVISVVKQSDRPVIDLLEYSN